MEMVERRDDFLAFEQKFVRDLVGETGFRKSIV